MLHTAQFARSVGRRDEKLSAASAAAVVVAASAVASSGYQGRGEDLPGVEVVVQVQVVLSVAESSSTGHSRKFPHKVGGWARA